jgi:hypothetical protein
VNPNPGQCLEQTCMVRPLLKVADRDEISMADNFATKNGKKKRNDRTLVLVMKFSSIITDC